MKFNRTYFLFQIFFRKIKTCLSILLLFNLLALTGGCSLFKKDTSGSDFSNQISRFSKNDAIKTLQTGEKEFQLAINDNLTQGDNGPWKGILGWRSFYFPYQMRFLPDKYISVVQSHGDYLLSHPDQNIVLEGDADARGSRDMNMILGENRAKEVAKILIAQGVAKKRIKLISFGSERPVALGTDELSYQLNRRVDIVYTDKSN